MTSLFLTHYEASSKIVIEDVKKTLLANLHMMDAEQNNFSDKEATVFGIGYDYTIIVNLDGC